MIYDCQEVEGWLNPQIYNTFKEIGNSLAVHDTEIAYQIGDQYFTIHTVEDGYDYTFYDKDYLELDGGVYDDPTISITEAMENILEEEGLSIEDGEYLRSAEITEEANYNMIDGLKNNAAPKDKKNRQKESVLAKLNEKKEEVARRTGQKAMQQVMESEGERTKK